MGLDMFLNARKFMWTYSDGTGEDAAVVKKIRKALPVIGDMDVKYVIIEAAYWRKANAIHDWFVTNVQDGVDECQATYVSREQLGELQTVVNTILGDQSQAATLLPTKSGFFFGGTDYDEWYINHLKYTKKRLDFLLKDDPLKGWEFEYRASW